MTKNDMFLICASIIIGADNLCNRLKEAHEAGDNAAKDQIVMEMVGSYIEARNTLAKMLQELI